MQGKRTPDNKLPKNPGEYAKFTNCPDGIIRWIVNAPNGEWGGIEKHTIIEHEDGTITVSPSILISTSYDGGKTYVTLWHGFLEKGIWRSC